MQAANSVPPMPLSGGIRTEYSPTGKGFALHMIKYRASPGRRVLGCVHTADGRVHSVGGATRSAPAWASVYSSAWKIRDEEKKGPSCTGFVVVEM